MGKRLLVVCSLLLLALLAFASCSVDNPSAVTLVPASANIVVKIQVDQILSNPALKKTYDELAKVKSSWPQTADDALNQLLQNTGVDPYTISVVVFFADIESANSTQNTYEGIIASGSFNESTIIAKIEQNTEQGMTGSDYKGFKVYSSVEGKFEIVFIDQGQIIMGTAKAVRDIIDIINGDQSPLSGSVITALDRVGTAQVTGAFLPPESLHHQVGESVLPQSLFSVGVFQDIDVIAFATDLQVLSLSSRIDIHFSNATVVQDAMDAITGMISIAKAATQEENIKTALSNIKVSTTDSWVSVRGLTSLADIITLSDNVTTTK